MGQEAQETKKGLGIKQKSDMINNITHSDSSNSKEAKCEVGTFDFIDSSLILLFKLHQTTISDIDGKNCPMQPTCSNYGIMSVQENGFLIGAIKTFDRLHRCNHDLNYYKIVHSNEKSAFEDYP